MTSNLDLFVAHWSKTDHYSDPLFKIYATWEKLMADIEQASRDLQKYQRPVLSSRGNWSIILRSTRSEELQEISDRMDGYESLEKQIEEDVETLLPLMGSHRELKSLGMELDSAKSKIERANVKVRATHHNILNHPSNRNASLVDVANNPEIQKVEKLLEAIKEEQAPVIAALEQRIAVITKICAKYEPVTDYHRPGDPSIPQFIEGRKQIDDPSMHVGPTKWPGMMTPPDTKPKDRKFGTPVAKDTYPKAWTT